MLLRSSASSTRISQRLHQSLAAHPNVAVRDAWVRRADIPKRLGQRRSLAEADRMVLLSLLGNPALHATTVAALAAHHPDLGTAVHAALHPSCPDDIAAEVLRSRPRTQTKRELGAFLRAGNRVRIGDRELLAGALAALVPMSELATAALWVLLHASGRAAESFAEGVTHRSLGVGPDDTFNAVSALSLCDAAPDARLRRAVRRHGPVLEQWVRLHDRRPVEIDAQQWELIASNAGPRTIDALLAQPSLPENLRGWLLQNPQLRTYQLSAIARLGASLESLLSGTTPWEIATVEAAASELSRASVAQVEQLLRRVNDPQTLAALAAHTRQPRLLRVIASDPRCSVELAAELPAAIALESYHDPVALAEWAHREVADAADAANTLSGEFSGSLRELIGVARSLVGR